MNKLILIVVIILCSCLNVKCEFFNLDSVVNIYSTPNNKSFKEKLISDQSFSPSLNINSYHNTLNLTMIGFDCESLGYHNRGEFYIYQIKDTLKYFKYNDFYEYIEVEDEDDKRDTTKSINRLIKKVSQRQLQVDIDTLKPKYIFLIKESTDSTLVYKALYLLENFTNPDLNENPKMKLIEQYLYFSTRKDYKIE